MPPPSSGGGRTNNVEVRLGFTADTSKAGQAIQKMTEDTKRLDRATQEASKQQERLARGGGMGPPPLPGSRGTATPYPSPPPLPTAHGGPFAVSGSFNQYRTAPQTVYRDTGTRGGADDFKATAMFAALGAAITGTVEALNKMAAAADRAAVATDPSGARLSRGMGRRAIIGDTLAELPLSQSTSNLLEFTASESPVFSRIWRGIGQDPKALPRAREAAYQARLGAAGAGPRSDTQRAIDEIRRRQRSAGFAAEGAGVTADELGERMPEFLRDYQGKYGERDPALFDARIAEARTRGGVLAARREDLAARQDVGLAEQRVITARNQLALANAAADPNATANRGLIKSSRLEDQAQRLRIAERETELMKAQEQHREALNRKQQTAVELAHKEFEQKQATLGVEKARLAAIDRTIAKQEAGATEFGLMDPGSQMSLLQTVQKWKRSGIGSLSLEERRQLAGAGITGQAATADIRALAERDPTFLRIQQELGQQANEALRRQAATMRTDIHVRGEFDEAQLRESMKKAMDTLLPELLRVLEDQLRGQLRGIERDMQMGAAANVA